MRILFLTHYFPPETNAPATRTYEHCREWVKNGDEVTVLTCAPNQPAGIVYDSYRNKIYQEEWVDGIRVIRIWTYLAANSGFARRTFNFLSYMIAALLAAPWLPKADIVLSTSPQFFCGLAGYGVSWLKRAAWVLEIRDLWPASILAVGAMRNERIIRLLEAMERFAYRRADRVVVVTDSFKDHIQACGVDANKIDVIKNGVDLSLFENADRDETLAAELGLQGKFVAAYFGTHGMAHGLDTILEAAELTRDDDRLRYLMVGNGAERDRLLAEKKARQLDNVIMLPRQERSKMPALWGLCDVGLVLLKKSDVFKTVIPSKIFEAMAMKKPMILGVEGECRELVEQFDCALTIEPENAEDLAAAVQRLSDGGTQHVAEMGRKGRDAVERYFDRSVLAQRYENLLTHTLNEKQGASSRHRRQNRPTTASDGQATPSHVAEDAEPAHRQESA